MVKIRVSVVIICLWQRRLRGDIPPLVRTPAGQAPSDVYFVDSLPAHEALPPRQKLTTSMPSCPQIDSWAQTVAMTAVCGRLHMLHSNSPRPDRCG